MKKTIIISPINNIDPKCIEPLSTFNHKTPLNNHLNYYFVSI